MNLITSCQCGRPSGRTSGQRTWHVRAPAPAGPGSLHSPRLTAEVPAAAAAGVTVAVTVTAWAAAARGSLQPPHVARTVPRRWTSVRVSGRTGPAWHCGTLLRRAGPGPGAGRSTATSDTETASCLCSLINGEHRSSLASHPRALPGPTSPGDSRTHPQPAHTQHAPRLVPLAEESKLCSTVVSTNAI